MKAVSDFLRKMTITIVDSALMPTGKNLVATIFFAVLITILNVVIKLFKGVVALRTTGCILAIVILLVILVMERSEYNAVSKLYRDAELRIKNFKARQPSIRSDREDG